MDRLIVYPNTIKDQVKEIFDRDNLCHWFAILAILTQERGKQKALSANLLRKTMNLLRKILGIITKISILKVEIEYADKKIEINDKTIFNIKTSLLRLANIVKYAANLQNVVVDETFRDFNQNYNPELIDKNKLFALINILRVELNQHKGDPKSDIILEKLDKIEVELKKTIVKWSFIISTFFMLFGFLADLKTLAPAVYNRAYSLTEQIITVLHQDGQVDRRSYGNTKSIPLKNEDNESDDFNGDDLGLAILPPQIRLKEKNGESK
jgi:hypothetical protein